MKIDDSFRRPGSIPFKWEIRPGVPKPNTHQKPVQQNESQLKPPPAGLHLHPQPEPQTRTHSLPTAPRLSSQRCGFPGLTRPDVISAAGCFPSPIWKQNSVRRSLRSEPDYFSDLGASCRWSVSSKKSVSRRSTVSPALESAQSSPRPDKELEWAAFGLF
ncbi:hypothetical protein ACS0TY_028390 [Phlomoides rotata]